MTYTLTLSASELEVAHAVIWAGLHDRAVAQSLSGEEWQDLERINARLNDLYEDGAASTRP